MQIDLIQALKNYLAVFNVQVMQVSPPFEGLDQFDYGLRKEIDPMFDWQAFGFHLLQAQQSAVLTLAEDTFGACYGTFLLPDSDDTVILVGPWRHGKRKEEQVQWAETYLPAKAAKSVQAYYDTIPQIEEKTVIRSVGALVQMVYPEKEFQLQKVVEYRPLMLEQDRRYFSEPTFLQDYSAELLEQRYVVENTFLDAIAAGDSETALRAFSEFQRFDLGERFYSTIRSRKNGLIVINTLFRKAIEKGGVHPYYVDIISTKYSYKIETVSSVEEVQQMHSDMIREYCAYVRRYSLNQYSPAIQKVINYINLNLDKRLALRDLADRCFISPSYLSNLFRQETGSTLTDYINLQRMQRAAHSLITTQKTVAAIAGEVGILDVNYFTKIFKKAMGCTPTCYRKEQRKI